MLKDLCFEVIQTCPNECKFCSSNSSKDKNKIIKIEIFKRTVDHFLKHGGIEELSISGGEPFLHPDLFEMVKYSKEKGIRTIVFTSGIKKSEEMTDVMVQYIKEKYEKDLKEIEKHEPWNDRLKKNVENYYEKWLNPGEYNAITKQELNKLKRIRT